MEIEHSLIKLFTSYPNYSLKKNFGQVSHYYLYRRGDLYKNIKILPPSVKVAAEKGG